MFKKTNPPRIIHRLSILNSENQRFNVFDSFVFYTYEVFQNTIKNSSTEKCII